MQLILPLNRLKNWRLLRQITKHSNYNHVITFDSNFEECCVVKFIQGQMINYSLEAGYNKLNSREMKKENLAVPCFTFVTRSSRYFAPIEIQQH